MDLVEDCLEDFLREYSPTHRAEGGPAVAEQQLLQQLARTAPNLDLASFPAIPQHELPNALFGTYAGSDQAFSPGTGLAPGFAPADAQLAGAGSGGSGMPPMAGRAKQAASAAQDKNRRAQQRFRERQKNKVQELEDRVQQLQQRDALLEKMVAERDDEIRSLRLQLQVASDQRSSGAGANAVELTASKLEQTLTLTVRGESQAVMLTAQDLRHMSRGELASLWKEYVHELGPVLVEAGNSEHGPAADKADRLARELCILGRKIAQLNPCALKALGVSELEQMGIMPGINNHKLWPAVLRSMNLSEQQKAEMRQLRRQYIYRLIKISARRREIITVLASSTTPCGSEGREVALDHLRVRSSMEELKANLDDEQRMVLDFVSNLLTHLISCRQAARGVVQAYPWTPDCLALCTWVAAEAGEPDAIAFVTQGSGFTSKMIGGSGSGATSGGSTSTSGISSAPSPAPSLLPQSSQTLRPTDMLAKAHASVLAALANDDV